MERRAAASACSSTDSGEGTQSKDEEGSSASSSSSEEEDDSSDDDDDDDADDEDEEEEEETVQCKVVVGTEIRGFCVATDSSRGFKKLQKTIRKSYGIQDLRLMYSDSEGDIVTIIASADFMYAVKNHVTSGVATALKFYVEYPGFSMGSITSLSEKSESKTSRISEDTPSRSRTRSSATSAGDRELLWQCGDVIGAGSFGRVFSGFNLRTGERLAIKEIPIVFNQSKKQALMSKSIQREIQILSSLETHPNIIRYYGAEPYCDGVRIFLELAESSIMTILHNHGALEEPIVRRYTCDILEGLFFLHTKRIVHRDIKPSNLLVKNNVIKLADFGCSIEGIDNASSSYNNNTTAAGTTMYMAPELLRAAEEESLSDTESSAVGGKKTKISKKSDIWSLGITLCEMANGKPSSSSIPGYIYAICVKKTYPTLPEFFSPSAGSFLSCCLKETARLRSTCKELLLHPFFMSDDIDFENNISRSGTRNGRPMTSTSHISFNFDEIVSRRSEEKESNSSSSSVASVWARASAPAQKQDGSALSYSSGAYNAYFARDPDFKGSSLDAREEYVDDFEADEG